MINFQNIISVSKYERKTLYRSWFFRIFSIITLVFMFGINMGFFGFYGGIRWTPRAIAANIPYINVLFVNVAQAIIAVFLASDFLRRDKKLDTTEVIYTRPVSNGEYVVGKTIGILTLFTGLVLVVLVMALIFNLVHSDVPVIWQAYVYYPLLVTVPTLVFILGLSFLLMIIIRNQAVTFVLLLGYIGLTLFYFMDKLHGMLDYMAFSTPMIYSDFIGFGEPDRIILHRLAYFSLGVGFIFATIRFIKRLPQVGRWNALNVIAFMAFVLLGTACGYRYYSIYNAEDKARIEYLDLNNKYADMPLADIVSNKLNVKQSGRRLKVSSELSLRNLNRQKLDTVLLSLNPGFRIDSIISNDGEVSYERNRQILFIIPEEGLAPWGRTRFTINYSGIPVESIAYLDIHEERLREVKRIEVAPMDKKPGIITGDFLLLTRELQWYPSAGVGFNHNTYLPGELDFTRFDLTVITDNNLIPVAPGKLEISGDEYHFVPEEDLNAFSLIAGRFEKRSYEFAGIECNLYLKPEHDYFSQYFTNINDTIDELFKEELDEWEIEELDLYYPFKRINLVEVPVQFHAYDRSLVQVIENIQPEIILMPEKGAGLNTLDFARYKFYEERRNRRENETRTPKEIEARSFRRFLDGTFFRSGTTTRPVSDYRPVGGEQLIIFDGVEYNKNPFCVFPLYYSYMTGISSSTFPLFNSMLEIYLKEGFEVSMRQSFRGGMTDNERANLALRDNSLTDIISDPENDISSSLIFQAGSFIFQGLKNKVGPGNFDNFLYYYLEDRAFREISFDEFSTGFYREFGVEVEPYFETINTKGKIPSFIMSTPRYIQTRDDIGEVYLIRFSLRNTGDARGMVDVNIRIAGGFGGGGPDEEKRLYELEPDVTKDIQITLFEQPRMMTVNTLVSGNIPSTFNTFLRSAEEISSTYMEEYERISERDLTLELPGEYIVDNEDSLFSYVSVSHESKLKKYIESRQTKNQDVYYEEIVPEPWWTPGRWTPYAHSAFYGEAVRSALSTRRGEGDNVATWTTILPSAGFYDVYVYIPKSAMFKRGSGRRREGGQGGGGGRGRGPSFADENTVYYYVISSNEGTEEIEFPLRNVEDGWNKLGAFHFPADTARIQLSDKTNGARVFADAVKWVER